MVDSHSDTPNQDPSSLGPVQRSQVSSPAPTAEEGEVLLRSRDVQALSRTFRRLAEIQDGLVDQLRSFEEERRNKWILPAIAIGCMALGIGLSVIGLVWHQKQTANAPIEVNLDSLKLPPIEVQAPGNGLDPELMEALLRRLEEMDQSQIQDRRMISKLGTKIVENEMSALALVKELSELEATQPVEAVAKVEEEKPVPEPTASPEDGSPDSGVEPERLGYLPNPWLGALNGLIAVDGYPHFRFQEATPVPGKPRLTDVVFFVWDDAGLLQSIVRAESVDFLLQQSTYSIQLHFQSGTRTRQGVKSPFPEGGLNVFLPDISVSAWLAHFPALSPQSLALAQLSQHGTEDPSLVDPEPSIQNPIPEDVETPKLGHEAVRIAVDNLLAKKHSFGHYRLERLGHIEGDSLKMIRLAWYDGEGNLFKYIEADTMKIRPRGEGWVELNLEKGCFIRFDKKSPFRDPAYRIHLPDQDLETWNASGAPLSANP